MCGCLIVLYKANEIDDLEFHKDDLTQSALFNAIRKKRYFSEMCAKHQICPIFLCGKVNRFSKPDI